MSSSSRDEVTSMQSEMWMSIALALTALLGLGLLFSASPSRDALHLPGFDPQPALLDVPAVRTP